MEKPSYDRMSEIATLAMDGLIQDDEEQALIYFKETLDLNEDECEYFGVNYAKMVQTDEEQLCGISLFSKDFNCDILDHLVHWEDGYQAITSIPYILICSDMSMRSYWVEEKEVDGNTFTIHVFDNGLASFGVRLADGSWMSSNSEQINEIFAEELRDTFNDKLIGSCVTVCDTRFGNKTGGKPYGIFAKVFQDIEEHLKESPFKEMERPSRYRKG